MPILNFEYTLFIIFPLLIKTCKSCKGKYEKSLQDQLVLKVVYSRNIKGNARFFKQEINRLINYPPLYEMGIKQTEMKPMKTTAKL